MEEENEDRVYLETFKALMADLLSPFRWLANQLARLIGTVLVWGVWFISVLGRILTTFLYAIGWLILMILTYILVICLWVVVSIWTDCDTITGRG